MHSANLAAKQQRAEISPQDQGTKTQPEIYVQKKGTLSNSVDGPWNSILKVEFFFYTLIASLKCWGVWLGPAGSVARRPQPHKFTENFLYLL